MKFAEELQSEIKSVMQTVNEMETEMVTLQCKDGVCDANCKWDENWNSNFSDEYIWDGSFPGAGTDLHLKTVLSSKTAYILPESQWVNCRWDETWNSHFSEEYICDGSFSWAGRLGIQKLFCPQNGLHTAWKPMYSFGNVDHFSSLCWVIGYLSCSETRMKLAFESVIFQTWLSPSFYLIRKSQGNIIK